MGANFMKKYKNLDISKSENKSEQGSLGISKFLINKRKMARLLKFKFVF